MPSVLWYCRLGGRKGIWPVKNMGRWWRWALLSPDGVAASRMVSVSACVNLPLHYKVQKFSSGTSSPGWSRKKGRRTVVCVCIIIPSGQQSVNQRSIRTKKSVVLVPLQCYNAAGWATERVSSLQETCANYPQTWRKWRKIRERRFA